MKKQLLFLALPVLLLSACNKSSAQGDSKAFKELRSAVRATLTNGIMNEGTFDVLNDDYVYDFETGEVGHTVYSFHFIKNRDLTWFKEDGVAYQYVLDYSTRTTYRKLTSSWEVIDEDPNSTPGALEYGATINVAANELTDNQRGKLTETSNTVFYKYKHKTLGTITYCLEYNEERTHLVSISRKVYTTKDKTEYKEFEIKNISYAGVIPEHNVD